MIKLSRLTTDSIQGILKDALDFAEGKVMKAKSDIFVANLFFEDSTRTKVSFEIAEKKLGLHLVQFDESKSSINKGETLLDTIKTLEAVGINVAVIRHQQTRYYDELKDANLKFRGSSNQRIIDIKKTKENKEITLVEFKEI